jgi:hypothetical protein
MTTRDTRDENRPGEDAEGPVGTEADERHDPEAVLA